MMRARIFVLAGVFWAALGAVCGQTPGRPAEPPRTAPSRQAPFYNVDTERQVEGVIQEVMFEPRYETRAPFLVVTIKEKGTGVIYRVEVSPAWFFNYDLHQGEPALVTGSFYTQDGENCLIARRLQAGGETFVLRDSRGFPNWRGGSMNVKGGRRGRGM